MKAGSDWRAIPDVEFDGGGILKGPHDHRLAAGDLEFAGNPQKSVIDRCLSYFDSPGNLFWGQPVDRQPEDFSLPPG
jgi:hypothetical protein